MDNLKSQNKAKYDFSAIEKKWQKRWEKEKAFEVKEGKGKKFYCLEMFPYPSGSGLHMGHAFNYSIGDVYARFKRMMGMNVLYPMGYDSFGLPAENAAIKAKSHPKIFTEEAIKNFISQQKALGLSYDWSKTLKTSSSEYYKWNQYFFIKLHEKGLIYRKKASVNWCNKCNTVLANEQVHNGRCWRHSDEEVQIKQLEQWFIKTTEYAEELLKDIEKLDWPERIKSMQRNWLGKSEGAEIDFEINKEKWKVFTTRPDTIFGVTFLVISAQHSRLNELVTKEQKKEVEKFLKKIKSTKQEDMDKLDKEGVFTGSYAINPMNGKKVPVYAGNFVVADYASGIVMAVPAHDERDFEFAKKYKLPIVQVIKQDSKKFEEAYTESGILINSGDFNGLDNDEAKEHIINFLKEKKLGKKTIQYKLRDWLVSRQRYWGTPIPMIYCDKCGIVPVNESQLPVLLPENFRSGEGNPLANDSKFVNTSCPKCKGKAKRETDTMDTFFDSSWYYLRYGDSKNDKIPFDKKKVDYWLPVDQYIGGAEHATMHLIYARFFTKALRDMGYVKINEPFMKLFNQGMLHGNDGFVMSKSRGNVVTPEEVSNKYGIDTARFFLLSLASLDKDTQWSDNGINGSYKFMNQVMDYFENVKITSKSDIKLETKINDTINKVTQDIESFKYNIALIKIRQLFSSFKDENTKKNLEVFLKLLNPFCPHITEELWEKIGNKSLLSLEKWPEAGKVNQDIVKAENDIEKTIEDIRNVINIVKEKQNKIPSKIYLYVVPKELSYYDEKELSEKLNLSVKIYAVNDAKKYDPENKSKKAIPGKPGIYLE